MKSAALLLLALVLPTIVACLASTAPTIDRVRTMYIVAVSTLPNGSYTGVYAKLRVEVRCPGNGHVYIETLPLTEIDTQASARVAAMVASMIAGVPFYSCDYLASIQANSTIVGGPSASLAMTVAFAAALLNLKLDPHVVMTGMIMPDGSVGPVGGVYYKLFAAARAGARVFVVPFGETRVTLVKTEVQHQGPVTIVRQVPVVVNLKEVGKRLGVEVVPVASVFEALSIATDGAFPVPTNTSLVAETLGRYRSLLEPVVKSWVVSEQKQLNATLVEVLALWKRVENASPGYIVYALQPLYRSTVSTILSVVNESRKLVGEGMLYAAASRLFYGLVVAKRMLYVERIVLNPSIVNSSAKRIIEEAERILAEIPRNFSSIPLYRLYLYMDVAERALDALMSARSVLGARVETLDDVVNVASELGYADARLSSATMWSELLNYSRVPPGPSIEKTFLVRSSQNLIDYARTVMSYLYALAKEVGVSTGSYMSRAEKLVSMAERCRNPVTKLTLVIMSLSDCYEALTDMFKLPSTAEALNRTLTTLMTVAIRRGVLPIDTALYLELAKGRYATEFLSRLSIRIACSLWLSSAGRPASLTAVPSPGVGTVTKTVTKTVTRTVLETVTRSRTLTVSTVSEVVMGGATERYAYHLSVAALVVACIALGLASLVYSRSRGVEHGATGG